MDKMTVIETTSGEQYIVKETYDDILGRIDEAGQNETYRPFITLTFWETGDAIGFRVGNIEAIYSVPANVFVPEDMAEVGEVQALN